MDITSSLALESYALARQAASPGAATPSEFSLGTAVSNFTDTLQQHEAVARAAMTGDADPHALVAALTSSQLAVETVATVRDRVVEAYQEILRMPV